MEYTTVVGVDSKTIRQLSYTFVTWKVKKPSLWRHPLWVFYDRSQLRESDVLSCVQHPIVKPIPWPHRWIDREVWPGAGECKWDDPQRHKMLAGFVYVGELVQTPYWLKLDTDVLATGMDNWIDERWFEGEPAIVAQPWGYTIPPDQMQRLDQWVDHYRLPQFQDTEPLRLIPAPGAERLRHKRICSWCAFFNTRFTQLCADLARASVGNGILPVPSQDGYMWYVAKRLGKEIRRVQMKNRGWTLRSRMSSIRQTTADILGGRYKE